MLTTSLIRFALPLSPASSATRALTLPSSQLASSGRDSLHLSTRMGANKKQKDSAAVTAFRNTYISKSADDVVPKYTSQAFLDALAGNSKKNLPGIPAEELPGMVVAVLGKAYKPSGVIADSKSRTALLRVSQEKLFLSNLHQAVEPVKKSKEDTKEQVQDQAEEAATQEQVQDQASTKPSIDVKAKIREQAIGLLSKKLAGQTKDNVDRALGNWNLTLQMVLHGNDFKNEYKAIAAQELNLNAAAKQGKKKNKK